MVDFLNPAQSDELVRSFALGLGGKDVALPAPLAEGLSELAKRQRTLAALALLAQHQRFAMPVLPLDEVPALPHGVAELHGDPRPIPPASVRRALSRLLSLPDADVRNHLTNAALDRLEAGGYRPHPFDLPSFRSVLQERHERLGAAENAYLRLSASDQAADQDAVLLSSEMTRENWQDYTPAPRIAFLHRMRREDPQHARAMIEECFAGEPANLRADMIRTLAVRLSADDEAFLTEALSDRAQSVKMQAGELLSRLPGTDGYQERLKSVSDVLRLENAGLIKRSTVLKVRPRRRKGAEKLTAFDVLAGIRLSDLAHQAGFQVADTAALVGDDDELCIALIAAALEEGDYDTAKRIAADADAGFWDDFLCELSDSLDNHPPAVVGEILLALAGRDARVGQTDEEDWSALYRILGQPLPPEIWTGMFKKGWMKTLLKRSKDLQSGHVQASARYLAIFAVLVPAESTDQFAREISAIGMPATAPAEAFLNFQTALSMSVERTDQSE